MSIDLLLFRGDIPTNVCSYLFTYLYKFIDWPNETIIVDQTASQSSIDFGVGGFNLFSLPVWDAYLSYVDPPDTQNIPVSR